MTQQRVYLSGPMASAENFNFEIFDHVAMRLRYAGYDVFSPADHARKIHGSLAKLRAMKTKEFEFAVRRLLAYELNWIALNADVVFMLPGWEKSPGARAEHAAAVACKIKIEQVPVYFMPEGKTDGSDHDHGTDQASETRPHLFTT